MAEQITYAEPPVIRTLRPLREYGMVMVVWGSVRSAGRIVTQFDKAICVQCAIEDVKLTDNQTAVVARVGHLDPAMHECLRYYPFGDLGICVVPLPLFSYRNSYSMRIL